MPRSKKYFLLFWGLLETWVFSGSILGWSALHYMLKQEGVYGHLCNTLEVPSGNSSADSLLAPLVSPVEDIEETILPSVQIRLAHDVGCVAQDKVLNLAYTIGIFCVGFSAFIWGFLIDRLGLRIIRLLLNGLITMGTILLSVTTKETSYLIFPALTLLCLAGVPLRLANMQIANLFPARRSTVITLYSGAFTASASIFIFTKYGYDAGMDWEWVCYVLVAFSACMVPITLFCLPVDRIRDDSEKGRESLFKKVGDIAVITTGQVGKFNAIPVSPLSVKKNFEGLEPVPQMKVIQNCPEKDVSPVLSEEHLPFKTALTSFSFSLHQYWFSWLLLATLNYSGSLHLWMERISSDVHIVSMYTQIYGLCQVSSLILAPLAGIVMDRTLNSASLEPDFDKRKLIKLRSGFWPMLFTTMAQAIVQFCKFFENDTSVYISIAFTTILRSFHVAVATAYLRIRFPASHFNRLLGIMSTTAAVGSLLQFPLYVWESRSSYDVFQVNLFNCIALMLCFVHPLHLLITPLQKKFIRKERDIILKAKSTS
ncbi:solute carrier family 43 member 3 [Trichonephila inaurata madagascariensis]|uniref:Solute carrier family 43 member 3 n=1 Tax=Trichonephila inaurata madagascariensis TaxID=2747483 RepID=A0A8X6YGZ8_9ARAC|nr:solute carrier family 43 member 3 [Trichonephila inaurata madagascariensis]